MRLILLFIFFPFITLHAQKILQGKVIDAISRQPLEGATVAEYGRPDIQVLTDPYGRFSLPVKQHLSSLVISYIGYRTATFQPDSTGNILISLQLTEVRLSSVTLQAGRTNAFNTIARIDLALKPVRNTQELLRLVPGLFIAQHAGGGKAEQIFLRGFDCDHGTDVQVSMDGMPVNMVSHAHGQGYADLHFVIPETVNRIDFGAGPYYAAQGNLNTAGFVNFSSFDNIDRSRVQLEAGRFDTYRALVMLDLLKKDKDRQSAYIASDYYFTNGPNTNPQSFKRYNIFGKYSLAVTNATRLTATLSSFTSKWNASGQVPERAVEDGTIGRFGSIDPSEGGHTERHNINLLLSHHFRNGANWSNQFFYSRYMFNLYSDFTFFLNDPVHGDEINQAEKRNLYGFVSKWDQRYQLGNGSLQSHYGVGVRYDATDHSKLAHVEKRSFLEDVRLGDIHEANAYAYAQQVFTSGKWLIDAGLRFDDLHFHYFDRLPGAQQMPDQARSILSPKLNIQYNISKHLLLYVKGGKGFHSNDTRVVVAQQGQEILPAAYGADLGASVKPNEKLFINAAIWYLYLRQEFVYVGDDGNIEPSGKTRRQGIDLLVRYQLLQKLFATININVTKARALGAPKGEDYIPLAPIATSTGGLYYAQRLGWNGSLTYRYIKDRPANEDNSIVAKGYFLLDAAVNYSKARYEIGLAFENLLNVKWNEAQFATESRLQGEPAPITELNFTPGTPFFARLKLAVFF